MSNKFPIIVGLDIGTTKVAAIAGVKNEYGKLEILGYGRADSSGVDHGMVLNIEQCIKAIELALANCLESNPKLDIKEVYVGIAGRHIKSMQTRGEIVRANQDEIISKQDIDRLVQDQFKTFIPAGDQIIDIIPQEFNIDGHTDVTTPIGRTGVKMGANFHIITGEKGAIRNINRCVVDCNLKVCDLVLQPLASAAAVASPEELEAGIAIVDIGGGTTDLAVYYDTVLKHTAVIPYAGVNITNDIKVGLNVLKAQAEQLKVQYGSALANETPANEFITIPGLKGAKPREISTKSLAHIIESRMVEIIDYVKFNLQSVGYDKNLAGGIILTGGGSQLKHLKHLMEFHTGYNCRLGHPNEHLASGYNSELEKPIYATCIGLILRGFDDFENGKTNFINSSANIMHNTDLPVYMPIQVKVEDAVVAPIVEEPLPVAVAQEPIIKSISLLEQLRRKTSLSKLFNIRKNLAKLFEEVDDRDLDNEEFK